MAAIADPASFRTARLRQDLARRFGLTGFWHWWVHELASLVPARVRAAFERRRARPVLAFDGARAVLWTPVQTAGRMRMASVAEIPLTGEPDAVSAGGRRALAPLAHAGSGVAPEVVIALPPRAVLRKTLVLPAAIEDSLHQALSYDLDRHTPFRADELYFDAAIVDRDPMRNTLQVELAAARRAVVDPLLRHAENFGARVVAVSVDPPEAAQSSRLDLLPQEGRNGDSAFARWYVAIPALLLVAGIAAALVLPLWQKRSEAIALNEQSDDARARATVSDGLRTQLERRVGDFNFALERKYAFPATLQVLEDVTRILPDDTWLTQLELRSVRGKEGQRELTLRGESANAGRLVSLLEESRLFTQTAPRSPTTKIQPGPGEIFDVGAQLKPLPAPEKAPLDMAARPAAPPPRPASPPPRPAAAAPQAAGPAPPATETPAATAASVPGAMPPPGAAPALIPPAGAPVGPTGGARSSTPPSSATGGGASAAAAARAAGPRRIAPGRPPAQTAPAPSAPPPAEEATPLELPAAEGEPSDSSEQQE
jgi:general secretion pathway protein L